MPLLQAQYSALSAHEGQKRLGECDRQIEQRDVDINLQHEGRWSQEEGY